MDLLGCFAPQRYRRPGNDAAKALGRLSDISRTARVEDEEKIIDAVASQAIGRPHLRLKPMRHFAQYLIAGEVAVTVVNGFE